ncbi:MAG: ATP-binding protein [bacterium]
MNRNKLALTNTTNHNEQFNIYLHTIVHELRSPLVSIQGFITLLAEDFSNNLPTEGTRYLERIFSNLSRVENLLTDITKLAKVSINEKDFVKISAREIIVAALESFEMSLNHKGIDIIIQPGFPEVFCDSKAMIQVYTNLISNAIKYARENKGGKIEIGYSTEELFHKFYVKDNGVGIRVKDRNKVFGLFSRLQNKKDVNGSGLGLSIVKQIIEGHGGEVWVVSRINQGTTIYFTLPKSSP